MRLDELIGLRLAIGFPGTSASEELIDTLQCTHAASLVVFSRNYTSPESFVRLLRELERAVKRRLLVMVDHEGGRVVRFHTGVTRFPDAQTLGRTQTPEAIEVQGSVEAEELARLGVRVNLAPCADVQVEGSDPIIGDRSYGSDPLRVSRFVAARIRGLQSHGVAACAKHFPGLGAVPRDPHEVLPTIEIGREVLERTHLPPFRAACDAGVAMMMSSHVCYPGLGEPPGSPATFSPRLIRTMLREHLGFEGLVLTDDLEMGALRAFGSMGDIAVRATEAGHDVLLICSDLAATREAFSGLRQAYESGRLACTTLEHSAARMLRVRKIFLPGLLSGSEQIW